MSFTFVPIAPTVVDEVRRTRRDAFGNQDLTPKVADEKPGFPCRVCLRDAEVGEPMLLFTHAPIRRGPYQSVGAVFIHAEACVPFEGREVPEVARRRMLSLRAFDANDRMVESKLVDGAAMTRVAESMLADASVRIVHVHFASAGCWGCSLERAGQR